MRKILLTYLTLFWASGAWAVAPNTAPIYTLLPVVTNGILTGNIASTKSSGDGTVGTDMIKVFTAGANGSYVSKLRITATATTPTTMTASVIRVFISTSTSGVTVPAGTALYQEVSVAALAAAAAGAGTNYYEVVLNVALPPNQTILCSIHANVAANTAWQITAFGGNY